MINAIATALVAGVVSLAAAGDETLREFTWVEGKTVAGKVVPPGDGAEWASLEISSEKAELTRTTVLTIGSPGLKGGRYVVRGRVRYENVEGRGFIEMWNHFGDEKYFTRTLEPGGPLAPLEGSSGWREVHLPFGHSGDVPPDKLEINVVLPGKGRVLLGPLHLVEFEGGWWTDRTAGLVFGSMGGLLGCLGGLMGTLCSMGRGRGFVIGSLRFMLVVGIVSMAAGVAALGFSQPYAVYYPLIGMGVLLTILSVALMPTARRRFEQIELRKMSSMDGALK